MLQENPDVYRTIKLLFLLERNIKNWLISTENDEYFHIFELASYIENSKKVFYDFISNIPWNNEVSLFKFFIIQSFFRLLELNYSV